MKIRVHELAAELKLPHQRVLELLRAMGIRVKGPSSAVEDHDADALRGTLRYTPSLRTGLRTDWPRRTAVVASPPRRDSSTLFERSGFATLAEWYEAQVVTSVTSASREAAAAQSRAIYEADRLARYSADASRRHDLPERTSAPTARRITFVQGGAPGLGKRR
ncbi:translation initiation factor IF-2 N-terminal domain-containing protein [Rathayibacter oskolensis]|uniref:translation initiation factor IF-2 N-terminal domain-containing protein n=1 Tax=Rathayibacter oskolensis TaxID=1891671 RepID=UPI000A1CD0A3